MSVISGGAKRVSDIIGVIDGIALQTNILALNAAPEQQEHANNVGASQSRLVWPAEAPTQLVKSRLGLARGWSALSPAGGSLKELISQLDQTTQ